MKKLSGCQRNIWFHFHATFYWQKQQQTNPARQQIYQRIYICIGFEVLKKIQEDTPHKYRRNKSRQGIDSKNRVSSVVKFCRRGSTRRRVLLKKSAKKKPFHSPLIFTWIISRLKVPIFDFQSQFTTLKIIWILLIIFR